MPEGLPNPHKIDATPTKDLFIEMLTRDVPLLWAILDVVDNSVDAARKRAPNGNLAGFNVNITVGATFRIQDNCGGMTADEARRYAFRFGRSSENPASPYSVGQFGVGMKRTLFKLGTKFCVISKSGADIFKVDVDVEEWKRQMPWEFEMQDVDQQMIPASDGVDIAVSGLHPSIEEVVTQPTFANDLKEEIERVHYLSLSKGLTITVNGDVLRAAPLQLKQSDSVTPYRATFIYRNTVTIDILCGIADKNIIEGGWYIFCNDRMVLYADQTDVTGWGEGRGRTIPKYHADFAHFRGYVFFHSSNAKLLPWTSGKNDVDTDSLVYRYCKEKMIAAMRLVIDKLRSLENERSARKQNSLPEGKMKIAVDNSPLVNIDIIRPNERFDAPDAEIPIQPDSPNVVNILYKRDVELVDKAKLLLGVTSASAVGEKTFDYFMRNEG